MNALAQVLTAIAVFFALLAVSGFLVFGGYEIPETRKSVARFAKVALVFLIMAVIAKLLGG